MLSRAPLFPAAIACTAGGSLAIALTVSVTIATWLLITLALAFAWWIARQCQSRSTLPLAFTSLLFYLMIVVGSGAYTAMRLAALEEAGLHHLSEDDAMNGDAVWRGRILSRPKTSPLRGTALHPTRTTSFYFYVESAYRAGHTDLQASGPLSVTLYEHSQGPSLRQGPGRGAVEAGVEKEETGGSAQAISADFPTWQVGEWLQLRGPLQRPSPPRNPGQLDLPSQLRQQGICWIYRGDADLCTRYDAREGIGLRAVGDRMREWVRDRLCFDIEWDPAMCDLLTGMVLGTHQLEDATVQRAFRVTGTYHVFAVSGQNVMVFATVCIFVLWLAGFNTYRWSIAFIPLVVFYCGMTGFEASAIRALIMSCMVLVAWSLQQPISALNTWSATLLLYLLCDPLELVDIGFQLSFAVVVSLMLFSRPLYNLVPRPWHFEGHQLIDHIKEPRAWIAWFLDGMTMAAASSVSAWLGSLPFMLWHFHQISWIAPLANIPVIFLAGLILMLGTAAVLTSFLSIAVAGLLNQGNRLLGLLLIWMVQGFASIPGSSQYVPALDAPWYAAEPELLLLDGGPGSGTTGLLRYGFRTWLINPGAKNAWIGIPVPACHAWGVNRLESVIVTELTLPQAGASEQVLEEFPTSDWIVPPGGTRSYFYRDFLNAAAKKGLALEQNQNPPLSPSASPSPSPPSASLSPSASLLSGKASDPLPHNIGTNNNTSLHSLQFGLAGMRIIDEPDFSLTILSPSDLDRLPTKAEDRSLVLLLQYKQRRLLWAGRLSNARQREILQANPLLTCDLLVQGWTPQTREAPPPWLTVLHPHDIVHPSPGFRDLRQISDPVIALPLAQRPRVWLQQECGALRIRMGATAINLSPFLTAPAPSPKDAAAPKDSQEIR